MTRYKRWMDRESENVLPYTVIIDTEEMWIQEISPAESKHYRQDMQKVVPSKEWLRNLYQHLEALQTAVGAINYRLNVVYQEARWLSDV